MLEQKHLIKYTVSYSSKNSKASSTLTSAMTNKIREQRAYFGLILFNYQIKF
jgi:hypothetical protein